MKIVHILSDSNIGGAGKLLYNISACIDRKTFEFVFIFTKNSKLIKLFKPLGFKIYSIDCGADKSFDIKSILKIRYILQKEKPQIVHTHSSLSGRIALKISGLHYAQNVYTKHCVFGVPNIMSLTPLKVIYGFFDDLLSEQVIAVAKAAKEELIGYGIDPHKIKVIINGSPKLTKLSDKEKNAVREKLGIKNGEFVVGISARLEKYKGHRYLLEAAKIATKNNDKIKFVIMGDGSYKTQLEEYARKLEISKNVIFLGFVDNVAEYVNIFDVNVNCSVGTETSSLSISEGLSIGKPAIVSNFGGNPNMVINGKTGYIIDQADPKALYEAILKLKNNNSLYNNMSLCAINDFKKRFSDNVMTKKYEKIYKDLISNNVYRN